MPDTEPFETATVVGATADFDNWPVVGAETQALRDTPEFVTMGEAAADGVIEEARRILRRAAHPEAAAASDVGLVTGYVQSGKTLSFTTVCALARDNGIPLVIIITGISTNLFGQSTQRLERDLRLTTRHDRKWLHIPFDTRMPPPAQRIEDRLSDWRDPSVPDRSRQTVVMTVMKNHRHLDQLIRTLGAVPLDGVRALVIDDEGDQASLNYLVNRGRESTTYRQIGRLRQLLPRHTYVQYTATPQAPLLINIIDALSPAFAEVLTPGPGYVGGSTFFSPAGSARYVRTIPPTEIFTPQQVLTAPPPSFRLALVTFFVGVAAGEIRDGGEGNRSMMVHPHQTRALHGDYFVWTQGLKADWQRALTAPEGDESRAQVTDLLRMAYDDLASTVEDLPAWDRVFGALPRAIRLTTVHEVNAARGQTPTIPWRDSYAHILVGGQAMDRGFTVEGLTVTYMPRGIGDANADTVQQRARFFGYKQRYLGYCRVWLEQQVRDAFESYVEHEEDMRKRLSEHAQSGRPLRDWKRAFFLDQALRPTRRQVLDVAFARGNDGQRWVDPSRPHELLDAIEHNNAFMDRFVGTLTLVDDDGDPGRTVAQRHKVAERVPLRRVYEQLLEELRLPSPDDSLKHTALLLQIAAWLEAHPDATCSVYAMRPGAPGHRTRNRNTDDLDNFYQGANPSTPGPDQGSIYPGDQQIKHPTDLTVQIHTFELRPHPGAEDQTIYPRVSLVATHVPGAMGRDWLVQ